MSFKKRSQKQFPFPYRTERSNVSPTFLTQRPKGQQDIRESFGVEAPPVNPYDIELRSWDWQDIAEDVERAQEQQATPGRYVKETLLKYDPSLVSDELSFHDALTRVASQHGLYATGQQGLAGYYILVGRITKDEGFKESAGSESLPSPVKSKEVGQVPEYKETS